MTDIFLNYTKVDYDVDDADVNVGACIKAIEDELTSCGHVITGLGADGEEIDEWRDNGFCSTPLSEISELQILASPREELVQLGFVTCIESVRVIREELEEALTRYRDEEYREATTSLSNAIKTSNDFMMTCEAISTNISPSEPPAGFTELVESLSLLVELFEGINEALDSADTVTITDLIEYEALPLLMKVSEKLTLLAK